MCNCIYCQASRIDFGEPAVTEEGVHEYFTRCNCKSCREKNVEEGIMSKMFLDLLADFYKYCDKEKLTEVDRPSVEEFACWLDEWTDCKAEDPESDTLPSG